jgi:hypothetical protein
MVRHVSGSCSTTLSLAISRPSTQAGLSTEDEIEVMIGCFELSAGAQAMRPCQVIKQSEVGFDGGSQ